MGPWFANATGRIADDGNDDSDDSDDSGDSGDSGDDDDGGVGTNAATVLHTVAALRRTVQLLRQVDNGNFDFMILRSVQATRNGVFYWYL